MALYKFKSEFFSESIEGTIIVEETDPEEAKALLWKKFNYLYNDAIERGVHFDSRDEAIKIFVEDMQQNPELIPHGIYFIYGI